MNAYKRPTRDSSRFCVIIGSTLLLFSIASGENTFGQTQWKKHHQRKWTEYAQEVQHVRHGQYYKISTLLWTPILEYGSYLHNSRNGEWYHFFPTVSNSLLERGNYVNDQRQGLWISYYLPPLKTLSVLATHGGSAIVDDEKAPGQVLLAYDTTGQTLASIGTFKDGRKVGIWNYFLPESQLVHRYDHSSQTMLQDNLPDSLKRACNFLGGPTRLVNILQSLAAENFVDLEGHHGEAVVEIKMVNRKIIGEVITSIGSKRLGQVAINLLSDIAEEEWFSYAGVSEPLLVKFANTRIGNSTNFKILWWSPQKEKVSK